jgi:methyl-accepting chemotaxis protein
LLFVVIHFIVESCVMPQTIKTSIQSKILLAISLVFIAVLATSTLMTAKNERDLAKEVALEKAVGMAQSYFDGINTMMLTGTMDQEESLRSKYLSTTGVRDIRVVHAPGTLDGVTTRPMPPKDALDERAIKGEVVSQFDEDENGRFVTVLTPLPASANHMGTNCLSCHQVSQGTVLGAVRLTYSLNQLDGEFSRNLVTVAIMNLVLSILGIVLVVGLLRRIVISPLSNMRASMQMIEQNSDLTRRLDASSNDEVGSLALAINGMLDKFGSSLSLVTETSSKLTSAADRIASASTQTADAANQQLQEASSTERSILDLKGIASEAGSSAARTAEASVDADREAGKTTQTTRDAIAGILSLVTEIQQAAEVIEALDQRSQNVSEVLDVIKGIAEQTNLLALNAAIEAARAGEMGRGFAVVADEVRKLANMSHESTRSIEDIVLQLRQEAHRAVKVMHAARATASRHSDALGSSMGGLDQIAVRVKDIRELNAQMEHSVRAQADLTENVDQRVANIGRFAERTASEALSTRGVSEELVALSRELNALVSRFRLL